MRVPAGRESGIAIIVPRQAPPDYATPDRDMILRLTLNDYVRRFGPDTPLDLVRLNGLLAAIRQPLATKAEIAVWYGAEPDHLALN